MHVHAWTRVHALAHTHIFWAICPFHTWGSWVLKSQEQAKLETQGWSCSKYILLPQSKLYADGECSWPSLEGLEMTHRGWQHLLPSLYVVIIRQSPHALPFLERSKSAAYYTIPSLLWLEKVTSCVTSLCFSTWHWSNTDQELHGNSSTQTKLYPSCLCFLTQVDPTGERGNFVLC